MTDEYRSGNAEKYAQNIASDPTQQAVASRTAAYQEYVAIHGHPPIVEPSGIILSASDVPHSVAEYRAWGEEPVLTNEA